MKSRDAAEAVQAAGESALQARLRALAEVSGALLWVLAEDGTVREPQPALEQFSGMSAEQMRGIGWTLCIHPDDRNRVISEWARFLKARVPAQIDYRMRHRDGEYRWMRARAVPIFDRNGRLIEWAGVNEDITAERQAQQALIERSMRFEAFADALPHIAWEAAPDGSVVWLNRQYFLYTGQPDQVGLGRGWQEALHPDDVGGYVADWTLAQQKGSVFSREVRLRRYDGAMRWYRLVTVPMVNAQGRPERWYGAGTDVHEARLSSERIHQFVATLGHELRNPLAPVRNGVNILLNNARREPSEMKLLRMLDRQVEHMARLIDDLLDINRITTDRMLLRREVQPLNGLVLNAIETSRSVLELADHPIEVTLPTQELWVYADPTRLVQVICNLLTNAAKYSDAGRPVRVLAEARDSRVDIIVIDEGIGIAAEMMPRIFDMFTRAEGTQEGLGIGLHVAKRITELHGGTISAHSGGAQRGSRFTVTLPLVDAPPARAAASPPAPLVAEGRRRVLIVDDNHDAASSLATLVTLLGHDARVAFTGRDAIALASEFQPETCFIDIGMPDTDGLDVARAIRALPWSARAHLVALTGWGQPSDHSRSRQAGFDEHVIKPIDLDLLRAALQRPTDR